MTRMQPIRYNVRRSSFYGSIEDVIRESARLSRPVRIELGKRGGYRRDVRIVIGDDPHTFQSDWAGEEGRFSARLRAAATVLRDHGIRGHFRAIHREGMLTLERA